MEKGFIYAMALVGAFFFHESYQDLKYLKDFVNSAQITQLENREFHARVMAELGDMHVLTQEDNETLRNHETRIIVIERTMEIGNEG